MSPAAMPGSLRPPMGRSKANLPSGPFLGPMPVPAERREQAGDGQPQVRKSVVRCALRVKVRNLVAAHQRRHARVVQRHPAARVFERGPDGVAESGLRRGHRHGRGLGLFLLRGKALPEKPNAECAAGAAEGPLRAGCIVRGGFHHLRPQRGQTETGHRGQSERTNPLVVADADESDKGGGT